MLRLHRPLARTVSDEQDDTIRTTDLGSGNRAATDTAEIVDALVPTSHTGTL
jgi:hypothetical protein